MVTPPVAAHAYEAIVRPQEAALPDASSTAVLPAAVDAGTTTAAIGRSAAFTACSAFTMPAPHSLPSVGQAHSPVAASAFGQTGRPAGCGKALALACILAMSCAGVRLALTARISAAMPVTIGAEKLVPRFGFSSSI